MTLRPCSVSQIDKDDPVGVRQPRRFVPDARDRLVIGHDPEVVVGPLVRAATPIGHRPDRNQADDVRIGGCPGSNVMRRVGKVSDSRAERYRERMRPGSSRIRCSPSLTDPPEPMPLAPGQLEFHRSSWP